MSALLWAGCTTTPPLTGSNDAGEDGASGGTGSPDGATASGDDSSSPDASACTTPVAVPQVLPGEVAQVDAQCGSAGGAPPLIGPVPSTTMMGLSIGLPVRNQSQLNIYLQQVSDPTSPIYRHYLTTAEYTAMFGPTVCDYNAVIAWAQSKGLTVAMTYPNRTLVDVTGTAAAFDAALNVTFNFYRRPDGTQFYAPDRDPSLDLSVKLLAISGLDDCVLPQPAGGGGG
jgi:hypothetical protein